MSKIQSNEVIDDEDEYILDEVKGRAGAKKRLQQLNRKKLTQAELDKILLDDN